ncbi:MAG: SPOR domain-containing protein [Calothrix sp. SM1_5_4]|nr:SPOR domain-containing protein [Calothrix sp. SM1_5_4]
MAAVAEHAPEQKKPVTPESKTAGKGSHDAPQKIADKVVAGKAPTDGKKEERKPQSILPTVASAAIGKFSVQVASYADEKQAKEHAAQLHEKGLDAFYVPANVNGKPWYRVLVGLFQNWKGAEEYRAQFIKETGNKSAIVQKIVQ